MIDSFQKETSPKPALNKMTLLKRKTSKAGEINGLRKARVVKQGFIIADLQYVVIQRNRV